jgi:hypothetical protein
VSERHKIITFGPRHERNGCIEGRLAWSKKPTKPGLWTGLELRKVTHVAGPARAKRKGGHVVTLSPLERGAHYAPGKGRGDPRDCGPPH